MPAHKLPLIWSSAKQKEQVMYKYDPITHRTVRVCCTYQSVTEPIPAPLEPRPNVPQIIFANVTGSYSINSDTGNPYVSNVYIEWSPAANATSYQVFIAHQYASALPSTINNSAPLTANIYGSNITSGLFIDHSGPIVGTTYSKAISAPGYLNPYGYSSSSIRLFVFAYNSVGDRSAYPLYMVTFNALGGRIFLDRTNYYDTVTSTFYFFQNGLPDNETASIDDKPLSLV